MKEKIVIGKLKSRMRIIVESVLGIGTGVFVFVYLMDIFKLWSYYSINPSAYTASKVFIGILFILAFILASSSYGDKQIIVIDQKYLKYCSSDGFIAKYKQLWAILMNKDVNYEVEVRVQDIDYVSLSYSDIRVWADQRGHSMIWNIVMKDGTLIKIQPNNLYFIKEEYLKGIRYLEDMDIVIKDPYHLKEALEDQKTRFSEYIDKVNKHYEY